MDVSKYFSNIFDKETIYVAPFLPSAQDADGDVVKEGYGTPKKLLCDVQTASSDSVSREMYGESVNGMLLVFYSGENYPLKSGVYVESDASTGEPDYEIAGVDFRGLRKRLYLQRR